MVKRAPPSARFSASRVPECSATISRARGADPLAAHAFCVEKVGRELGEGRGRGGGSSWQWAAAAGVDIH